MNAPQNPISDNEKAIAAAVLGQLSYFAGPQGIEGYWATATLPTTPFAAQSVLDALKKIGFDLEGTAVGNDISLTAPSLTDSSDKHSVHAIASSVKRSGGVKGAPAHAELYFTPDGVKKLIEAGVAHPVLDAIAKLQGIELPWARKR